MHGLLRVDGLHLGKLLVVRVPDAEVDPAVRYRLEVLDFFDCDRRVSGSVVNWALELAPLELLVVVK